MNKTSIEWTDYTWNPVTGCDKVSAGCRSCYAETLAKRFWGERKFTDVIMHEDRLAEPEKNRKKWAGKKVFVCSMSDLFHESVSWDFLATAFDVMLNCPDTIFQILTKRPERVLQFLDELCLEFTITETWPLPNVWIGVSCENQEQADKRIPLLLQIPAAVRFLSCEPLLGEINLEAIAPESPGGMLGAIDVLTGYEHGFERSEKLHNQIHWVIAGGESGHNARALHPDWVRSLRDQCKAANVPFFFKQWGEWLPLDHLGEDQYWQSKKSMEVGYGYTSNTVFKVGKSKSGNMLDGRTHLEFPSSAIALAKADKPETRNA